MQELGAVETSFRYASVTQAGKTSDATAASGGGSEGQSFVCVNSCEGGLAVFRTELAVHRRVV